MAHRIRIHRTGGPEVLQDETYDVGEPGPGQVRLVQQAAGVNFLDTQCRDGIYQTELPLTLGVEGNGRTTLMEASADLWHAVETGILPPPVIARYPLHEARRAHEDIKARRVAGSMVLVM